MREDPHRTFLTVVWGCALSLACYKLQRVPESILDFCRFLSVNFLVLVAGMAGNADFLACSFCEPWSALWEARSADLNICIGLMAKEW